MEQQQSQQVYARKRYSQLVVFLLICVGTECADELLQLSLVSLCFCLFGTLQGPGQSALQIEEVLVVPIVLAADFRRCLGAIRNNI